MQRDSNSAACGTMERTLDVTQDTIDQAILYLQDQEDSREKTTLDFILSDDEERAIFVPRFESLIDALRTTTRQIQTVYFWRVHRLVRAVQYDAMVQLCDAIGKLSSLRKIVWEDGRLPLQQHRLQYLTKILQSARNLAGFRCYDVNFQGAAGDFQAFASALHSHPTLEVVDFPRAPLSDLLSLTTTGFGG